MVSTVSSGDELPNIEVDCLAHNMYREARGESTKGMIAVGHVTMNRTKAKGFPGSVCSVVTQKHKKFCQFTWVCTKGLPAIRQEDYEQVRKLAEKVYNGTVKDITRGATYFHNETVVPAWSETKLMTTKIGNHLFYRT
jgi:spore germination cell wall hydrolase CwlJ-like protein